MSRRITILLATVGMLLCFAAGVALAMEITCSGGLCEGTNREDTITGTPQDDTILARRGGDTVISNQGGVDTAKGGRGNDTINVSDGVSNDSVDCGRGSDDTVIRDPNDTKQNCEDEGTV